MQPQRLEQAKIVNNDALDPLKAETRLYAHDLRIGHGMDLHLYSIMLSLYFIQGYSFSHMYLVAYCTKNGLNTGTSPECQTEVDEADPLKAEKTAWV